LTPRPRSATVDQSSSLVSEIGTLARWRINHIGLLAHGLGGVTGLNTTFRSYRRDRWRSLSMPKIRLMLLGLVAVFAISAVAVTSASAHNFKTASEKPITKTFSVEGKSGASQLDSSIALEKIIIQCEKDTFTGSIETGGKNKGTIKFKECVLENSKKVAIAGCKVTEPIEAKVNSELTETPVQELFTPEAGGVFVTIEITGCEKTALNGKYEVKGFQLCKLPSAGVESVEHVIWCIKAGSSLKLGNEKASFESTEKEVKLTTAEKWSAE
jgi:hypothetical protein